MLSRQMLWEGRRERERMKGGEQKREDSQNKKSVNLYEYKGTMSDVCSAQPSASQYRRQRLSEAVL